MKSQKSNVNEYLELVDNMLKKNKGNRLNTLYDTDPNVPNQIFTASPFVKRINSYNLEPDSIDQLQYSPVDMINSSRTAQPVDQNSFNNTKKFLEQLGQLYNSPEMQKALSESSNQKSITDKDGGYLGVDGKFYYYDGTVRQSKDPFAYAIATKADGSILYSDNSIRRPMDQNENKNVSPVEEYGVASSVLGKNDYLTNLGNVREGTWNQNKIGSFNDYLKTLSEGRLSDKNITGAYGQYYGLPREKYNIGTDIGTGQFGGNQVDLALPFQGEVMSIGQWDGRNANSTRTPYGNSVLIKLPTGHIIRFSHLSQIGNIKVGDKLSPGTYLGTTGDTGHAFGSHLDHEMYQPGGKIISSEDFFNHIQNNPDVAKQLLGNTGLSLGKIIKQSENSETAAQNKSIYPGYSSSEMHNSENNNNLFKNEIGNAANFIEKTKPTGDYGVGLTELAKGDIKGAKTEIANTIDKINPTGVFDLGFTEALKGDNEASQTKRKQTLDYMSKALGDIIAQPAYASNGSQEDRSSFSDLITEAGQGVSGLKNIFSNILENNLFKKKDLSQIGQKNKIGENTSGSVATNLGDIQSSGSDRRDPFFKGGGAEIYKSYLQPGVTSNYRGALDLNLFKDSFFENADNVANVFGSTFLGKDATNKYKSYMSSQYPILPGGESPTIKKTATGKYDDGGDWSVEYEDVNPTYYQNQNNKSILDSIPAILKSTFSFTSPRNGNITYGGSNDQNLYQPVRGDVSNLSSSEKSGHVLSQLPASNIFQIKSQSLNIPASVKPLPPSLNKPSISASFNIPQSVQVTAPNKPSNSSSSSANRSNSSNINQNASYMPSTTPIKTTNISTPINRVASTTTQNASYMPQVASYMPSTNSSNSTQTVSSKSNTPSNIFTTLLSLLFKK